MAIEKTPILLSMLGQICINNPSCPWNHSSFTLRARILIQVSSLTLSLPCSLFYSPKSPSKLVGNFKLGEILKQLTTRSHIVNCKLYTVNWLNILLQPAGTQTWSPIQLLPLTGTQRLSVKVIKNKKKTIVYKFPTLLHNHQSPSDFLQFISLDIFCQFEVWMVR